MKEQIERLMYDGHLTDVIQILEKDFPAIYKMNDYLYSKFLATIRGYSMGMVDYDNYSRAQIQIRSHLNDVVQLIPTEPLADDDDGRLIFVSIHDSGKIYATFNKMPYIPTLIEQEELDKHVPRIREVEVDSEQSRIGVVKIYH